VAFFDVTFQTHASLHPGGEPSDYVAEYHGVVRCERDRDGRVSNVGRLKAYRIHAELAAQHGEPLFDVCDAHSDELHRAHTLLYEPGGYEFREGLVRRFDVFEMDCLVIDWVVLHPRWRGLKLGLLAVRKAADLLGGGCGLAVCDVAPLNADAHETVGVPAAWIPRHDTDRANDEATVKLRRYARRLGFVRLGRSPFHALPLNRVAPTAEDLLRKGNAGG
jgi:hypothetical protein